MIDVKKKDWFERKGKQRKGQISLYISLVFIIFIIILLTGLFAPMGAFIATNFYLAGEDLIIQSNATVQNIQDANVRAALEGTFGDAQDNAVTNIQVATNMYQYSWAILIFIAALLAFLSARRLIEYGGQGGFI
jgi:predicted PurR-regulated permease PerM